MNDTNDWRARAEAAEARLADLTAPAEGVDVEEVLRLDREATEGPWTMIIGNQGRGALAHVETDGETEAGVTICSINKRAQGGKGETNADLIAFYRSAAPALARALIAARADLSAPRAEVERVGAEVLAALVGVEAERDALRERLNAYEDDFRRVLAEECAPDERHCSCVPHLRAEVEELRLALAADAATASPRPPTGADGA